MSIRLRPLAESDFERIIAWQSDPALYDHLVGAPRDVTPEQAAAWMRRHWLRRGPDYRFALCVGAERHHIGNVYLLSAPDEPQTVEFHIFIGDPAERGQGWGRQALAAALEIAFRELGMRLVRLQVLETNAVARRLYDDAGFDISDSAEQIVDKPGGPVRVLTMALSRETYETRRAGAR